MRQAGTGVGVAMFGLGSYLLVGPWRRLQRTGLRPLLLLIFGGGGVVQQVENTSSSREKRHGRHALRVKDGLSLGEGGKLERAERHGGVPVYSERHVAP